MKTACKPKQLAFQPRGRREVDQRLGLLNRLAGCFTEPSSPQPPVRDEGLVPVLSA